MWFDESVRRERPGSDPGNLMNMPLPPAGVQGRTAAGVLRAAAARAHLHALSLTSGVCPECSAPVEHDVRVCEDHDAGDGLCDRCGYRLAVFLHYRCVNCTFTRDLAAVMGLLDAPPVLAFVGEHGLDTTTRGIEWGREYGEEILSTDPFTGRFRFTIEGDSLVVTVDEAFDVVESHRR